MQHKQSRTTTLKRAVSLISVILSLGACTIVQINSDDGAHVHWLPGIVYVAFPDSARGVIYDVESIGIVGTNTAVHLGWRKENGAIINADRTCAFIDFSDGVDMSFIAENTLTSVNTEAVIQAKQGDEK